MTTPKKRKNPAARKRTARAKNLAVIPLAMKRAPRAKGGARETTAVIPVAVQPSAEAGGAAAVIPIAVKQKPRVRNRRARLAPKKPAPKVIVKTEREVRYVEPPNMFRNTIEAATMLERGAMEVVAQYSHAAIDLSEKLVGYLVGRPARRAAEAIVRGKVVPFRSPETDRAILNLRRAA